MLGPLYHKQEATIATKSIIDIDVNDGSFQRFFDLFKKYQDALKQSPDAWRQTGDEAVAAAEGLVAGAEAIEAISTTTKRTATDTSTAFSKGSQALGGQAEGMRKVATSQSVASRLAQTQAQAWRDMAKSTRTFASHITDATRSLLRWASITGVISGILGGGGLFGIDRLAASAADSRRSARGLGMSPGEEKSFELNYKPLMEDPRGFLAGVNQSILDPRHRVDLMAAGVNDIKGKSTYQISNELVQSIKQIADQTDKNQLGAAYTARHINAFMSLQDFQNIKDAPASEVLNAGKNAQHDMRSLDLTKQQQKAWSDLSIQLHRAGETLETMFTAKLTDLAPQIGHLSEAFVKAIGELLSNPNIGKWIDDLAGGVKWLGDYIGSAAFHTDVDKFVDGIGNMASAVGDVFTTLKSWIDWWKGSSAADLINKGGVNGPIQDDNPYAAGSPEWKKRQEEIARSHGVAPDDFSWLHPSTWGHQQSNGQLPRGVRNNNWLNLSYVPGQGAAGSDGRFGVYSTPEAGIAASENQLLRYQASGLDTIGKIISRWAPPSENDTAGYIADIAKQTGKDPNARFDVRNKDDAAALIAAMARHETGRTIDPQVVQRGVGQALSTAPVAMNQGGRAPMATVVIHNNTGGSAVVSASQLAM